MATDFNRFELLDEDAPKRLPVAKEQKKEKKEEKKKKPAVETAPKKQTAVAMETEELPAAGSRRGAPGGRGRPKGAAVQNAVQQGLGRGVRLPRGLENNTGKRLPKRVFDRHSGTGRGTEVRKGGVSSGAGAIGTWQDEKIDYDTEKAVQDAAATGVQPATKPAEGVATAPADAAATEKKEEPKKEETEEEKLEREEREKDARKKTLDQELEERKKKAVPDDLKHQVREVVIDEKQFKAAKPLSHNKDDEEAMLGKKEEESTEKKKSKKEKARKAISVDEFRGVDTPLAQPSRQSPAPRSSPPPRGGGSYRGAAGRGGSRRGRGYQHEGDELRLNDESSFPKLGK